MYKAAHFCRPFLPIFFLFACASTYHLGIFLCQNMKLCSVCFSLQCCQFVLYYFVQNLFEFKARGTKVFFFREIHFTKISQRHADQTLFTFWKQSDPAACLYNGALAELLFHDLPEGVAPNDSISYLVTLRNLRKIYTHT